MFPPATSASMLGRCPVLGWAIGEALNCRKALLQSTCALEDEVGPSNQHPDEEDICNGEVREVAQPITPRSS